jgi:hypothetical protein
MRDLHDKQWTAADSQCPVLDMIRHFNQVSAWVIQTILLAATPEKRVRTIDRFRQLACVCSLHCPSTSELTCTYSRSKHQAGS